MYDNGLVKVVVADVNGAVDHLHSAELERDQKCVATEIPRVFRVFQVRDASLILQLSTIPPSPSLTYTRL